jgi:hypothetical protein
MEPYPSKRGQSGKPKMDESRDEGKIKGSLKVTIDSEDKITI